MAHDRSSAPGDAGSRLNDTQRRPGVDHQRHPAAPDLLTHSLPGGAVRRGRVLRRFETLPDDVRLVLVAAPAGYGKTTVVRQWVQSSPHVCAWLQVDASDSDPIRLARDIALALPGLGAGAEALHDLAQEGDDLPPETIGWRLAAAVRAVGRPVLLVLDGMDHLRSRRCLELVLGLAEQLPPGSRLVATANHRPQWRVGRLLAQGRYFELDTDDLRFSREEAALFLTQAGLHLPAEVVDELAGRIEGWPLGLQLTARTLSNAPDPVSAAATLTGASQVFADYFRNEVLAGHTVETTRFLMYSAVLDTMCASLCDSALASTGSAARLAEVRSLGLFLSPEDESGDWYRYHPLFVEMLRAELRRREPGMDLQILRNAAQWYEDQGRPVEAIEHAVAGRAALPAARLIVAHAQALNSRGEIDKLRRWLEALDEDTLERYPPLAVMAVWVWALTGDAQRARRALLIAESASFAGPLPDGSATLESAVLRARAALVPDGVERMLVDAERAVALEPPGSRWHTLAALELGVAYTAKGHRQEAVRWFERAALYGSAEQRPGALIALAEHALLAADQGDWSRAESCLRDSVHLRDAGGGHDFLPALTSHLAEARVAAHRGETRQAIQSMQAAMSLYEIPSPMAFPWLAVQAAVTLGHLLLDLGDVAGAERKLAEARRHVAVLPTVGVLQAWVDRLAIAVEFSITHSMLEEASALTTAELRVLRLLPTHLSLAEIADEFVVSRNTVKSQVAALYSKLGVENRSEAVTHAEAEGLLGRKPPP